MSTESIRTKSVVKIPTERDIEYGAEKLNQIFSGVLPWVMKCKDAATLLKDNTIQNAADVNEFLGGFYLFKIGEVSVSADDTKIAETIYKRQQAIITASYQMGYTLATVIAGGGGGYVDIYMAVKGDSGDVAEVFEHIVRGVYPGKGMIQKSELSTDRILHKHLKGKIFGGVITGIPAQKIDNEKQIFDLTSVIRSLNGQKYLLAVISRPVPKVDAANHIFSLLELKDQCHSLANRRIGMDESLGNSVGDSHTSSEGIAKTIGTATGGGGNIASSAFLSGSLGATVTQTISYAPMGVGGSTSFSFNIGATLGGALTLGGSGNRSSNKSYTDTKDTSESVTTGWSKSVGESISYDQQNSLAIELEQITSKLIERIRIGLNNGLWENFITFATENETASKILSGTLAGELIKGDPESLPVRIVTGSLNNVSLFIPKKSASASDLLSANRLYSYMSSTETALLMSPPLQAVPGYEVRAKPLLSLTDNSSEAGFQIGTISEHGEKVQNADFCISHSDIRKHIFVSGLTGSGKTTTVKQILDKAKKPFLVVESAKREYRRLLSESQYATLKVYTVGDVNVSPIRHNPFWVMPNVSVLSHIDNLKSTFNASFALYGPMPYILERCLTNIYRQKGWDLTTGKHKYIEITDFADCRNHRYIYPTLPDLKAEVNRYVKTEMEYRGELQDNIRSAIIARIDSLCVGSKGFLFNTHDFIDVEMLLNSQTVMELESLADDDDKAFFVGLVLILISEYRQSISKNNALLNDNDELKHILVIEEAHRLLKNVQSERSTEMLGNPRGKAVESFCNIISEMRSLGQGIIVAEQIPTKIAPDVIKNTNTKIIHRLVSSDDQTAVGSSLGLTDDEARYLNQLSTGVALAHKEGMSKPVEIILTNDLPSFPVDDLKVGRESSKEYANAARLHESGLLDNDQVFTVGMRMTNSFLLSCKEIKELLKVAVPKIQVLTDFRESEEIITIALKEHVYRVLFSQTYGLYTGERISEGIVNAYNRLWEDDKYSRSRFVSAMNEWTGGDVISQMSKTLTVLVKKQVMAEKVSLRDVVEKVFIIEDRMNEMRLIEKASL